MLKAYHERQLMQSFKRGDRKALHKIYDNYSKLLVRILSYYSKDQDQIKDWVQEVYVNLWRYRHSVDYTAVNFKGYLIVMARNHAIKCLKKPQKYILYENDYGYSNISSTNDVEDYYNQSELMSAYLQALTKLPPKTCRVFNLSREEGLSYKMIADQLGVSVKTVETQMSHALRILRKELVDFL